MKYLQHVSDFSYPGWLLQNNFNPSDILSHASEAKLLETLGLQKFMKSESCNAKEGVYKNPYQGWTSGSSFLKTNRQTNLKQMKNSLSWNYQLINYQIECKLIM